MNRPWWQHDTAAAYQPLWTSSIIGLYDIKPPTVLTSRQYHAHALSYYNVSQSQSIRSTGSCNNPVSCTVRSTTLTDDASVCWSGVVVSTLASINEVNLRRARLVLRWATVSGFNSAFHPSGVGKWIPASAGKAKANMVHSVSGWTRGVQVKLWDPLRTRAIPERLRVVFTTRRYTNPRLPYLTIKSFTGTWTAWSVGHSPLNWQPISPAVRLDLATLFYTELAVAGRRRRGEEGGDVQGTSVEERRGAK